MSHSRTSSLVSNSSSAAPAAYVDDGLPAKSPAPLKRRSTGPVAPNPAPEPTTKLARNVAPGLLARMKFLNQGSGVSNSKSERTDIGRIDDGTIRKLDDFHKDRSFSVERRGTTWGGLSGGAPSASQASSPLVPQLTGESTASSARNDPADIARTIESTLRQLEGTSEPADIGRIDDDTIRRLDEFHRDRSFSIERRGTTWSGISDTLSPGSTSQACTPLIPQLTGETIPTLAMEPEIDSDRSSVVSTSDKVLPSESEAGADDVLDMQKYRLPDITKSKTLLQGVPETLSSTDMTTAEPTRAPTPPPKDPPKDTNTDLRVTPRDTPSEGSPARPLAHTPSQDTIQAPPPEPQNALQETPQVTPPADEVSVLDDHNHIDIESYFKKRHLPRAGSIYSLSKASFTNQIQGLTSMKLPPTTIASEITALPSSTLAARALHKAANDIRLWMAKAAEVLNGLDAEDDVEWAAAAGREGLAEVDAAIGKFEGLVTVYITAIEDLQARADIKTLPSRDLTTLVTQMEEIVSTWSKIKKTLKDIKNQVEMAMEWEELWNGVLGEIGHEIEELSRHVFEMEERRHRVISDSVAEAPEKFEIADLETIVEETPRLSKIHNNRFSLPPNLAKAPVSPIPQIEQENSRLLALFAKLQPLRASLDFLPMRLASFEMRAKDIFPSACDELKRRKEQLEQQEKKLEADAEALREELGEDKWVHSFRQAGSKAVALYDSCMKSVQKLQQAIDENDEEKIMARIATYTDKRDHYPPSMRRVLELIDIEMKHRSTVNGEILRIQQDVRTKVSDLERVIADMDKILEEFNTARKLRDSISTTLSAQTEGSLANSTIATPNSSPASSVVMSRNNSGQVDAIPSRKPRLPPLSTTGRAPNLSNRRHSSVFSGVVPRKGAGPTYIEGATYRSVTPTQPRYVHTVTPATDRPKTERPAVKPRWNSSTNMKDTVVGHNFRPMSLTTPSPFRKGERPTSAMRSVSSQSNIPVRSPLSRSASLLSPTTSSRPPSTMSLRRPLASPMQSPTTPARSNLPTRSTPGSSSHLSPGAAAESGPEDSPVARRAVRSVSAMNNRRSSYIPPTKKRTTSTSSLASTTDATATNRSASRLNNIEEGRNSRASRASGRQSSMGDRPAWR